MQGGGKKYVWGDHDGPESKGCALAITGEGANPFAAKRDLKQPKEPCTRAL